MSTQALAEVLIEMLENEHFCMKVMNGDPKSIKSLKDRGLSSEEINAITTRIERWETNLLEVASVGAWKLITSDLTNIDQKTKEKLNRLLAQHLIISHAIPVTGS